MIPNAIARHHVIAAMERLGPDESLWPPRRKSKHYDVIHPDGGWRMPPKLVLSIAALIAVGRELMPTEFTGGDEANGYLEHLGITVIDRRKI